MSLNRDYTPLNERLGKVLINNSEFIVPAHPFWTKFASGWEPDTERIYQQYTGKSSTVLDIGAWIGPTIIFALAYGADNIIALEPNPGSYALVRQIPQLNPHLANRIKLIKQAISNRPGKLMMGLARGESDTSTSGIIGRDFQAQAITISQLIDQHQLDHIDLIKIDIEGAEVLLAEEFETLSRRRGQVIHLSVHVPFFPQSADKSKLAESLTLYNAFDDRGYPIDKSTLAGRILTTQPHPDWGTKHGNFFELLLIAD